MCTGYGGLDLAVEHHFGASLAWYSELEPACCQVLNARFEGIPNHGDLTAVDWSTVEPVDVLCAGFPCQPFSTAGKRKGEEDERAIWPIIAQSVSILRPRVLVLENVSGLLTLGGAGVIGDLAALGYDCRWGVVRASDAGATHRRARWFCIASNTSRGNGGHTQPKAVDQAIRQTTEPREPNRPDTTDTNNQRSNGAETPRDRRPEPTDGNSWAQYGPAIERWAAIIGREPDEPVTDGKLNPAFVEWMMGLPAGWVTELDLTRSQKLKMLGNGVVPQQAALALRLLA
jgi:DNA (cytosine-5)-methyltransferase 1